MRLTFWLAPGLSAANTHFKLVGTNRFIVADRVPFLYASKSAPKENQDNMLCVTYTDLLELCSYLQIIACRIFSYF